MSDQSFGFLRGLLIVHEIPFETASPVRYFQQPTLIRCCRFRGQARGTERYGIVVSSQANRLKPLAIDVRLKPDPVHWFLAGKDDVRSSYYLEDVSTEFDIQGLELDWVCVTWDADFRYKRGRWIHRSFRGNKWQKINKIQRQVFQKNAYRVLLTRARQGMIICIPSGDPDDPTKLPEFYTPTYEYLRSIGIPEI